MKYVGGEKLIGPVIIAGSKALCETCPRRPKDSSKLQIPVIRSIHETKIEEGKCFLEQGILCLGPVTREGCEHSCINMNMPCTGCFGPLPGFEDVGLRYIAGVLALVAIEKEKELMELGLAKILDKLVDRLGLLYRYTLPQSRLYKFKLGMGL
jgi:F420-non-reducing hydrogenase small subunit